MKQPKSVAPTHRWTETRDCKGAAVSWLTLGSILKTLLCYVQVCPAGWTPGSSTMKPTPKDSKDYFAAL